MRELTGQDRSHAVVVGAGQGGFIVAATLRNEGFSGRITLVGAEALAPYQRPPLSKSFLLGSKKTNDLLLRPTAFFDDQRIALRLGVMVEAIRPEAGRVELSGGTSIIYDVLALATGAVPRRLPESIGGSLDGVLTLRTVEDAALLSAYLSRGRSVVIIGGGYIGLEVAATCVESGLQVTVIEASPRILQRVAAPETSEVVRRLHVGRGVAILEECQVAEIIGNSRVSAVRLTDGRVIAADVVVVAIGVSADTRLAEGAGLKTDNGISVDSFMRTSEENIWAAGDCASFAYRGQSIRIESVGNAIDAAETAARNMLGRNEPFLPQPWFWSDQYDCRLQIAGLNQGYDALHVRTNGAGISHWYYRGDELLAVDAINDSRAYLAGKRLIEMGRSPAPHIVSNPEIELKSLLRA